MHLKVKSYYPSVNNQGITWYHHHRGTTHHHRFTRSKSRRTTVPTLKAAISWIYCSSNKHCHHQLHHLSALASIESQSWNSKVKKFPVPKYNNIIAIASSRRRPWQSPVWHSATLVPRATVLGRVPTTWVAIAVNHICYCMLQYSPANISKHIWNHRNHHRWLPLISVVRQSYLLWLNITNV